LLTIRVGLTFLIGLALIWVSYETLSEGSLLGKRNTYEISGQFDTVKQLKNGDDVRLSGVRLGTGSRTLPREGKGVAIMVIDDQFPIPRTAVASTAMSGLRGGNTVGVPAPAGAQGPFPSNGEVIQTRATPDFNTILSQVGEIGE